MHKVLVGRGHAEFTMMRQQDAEEFLMHLFTALRRHVHRVHWSELSRRRARRAERAYAHSVPSNDYYRI
ncbi:hypothetical protein H4582DRAFT_2079194 [Lactarius indigo]|nr:hypothetical protein H4582DRAFT_2079194 [Lactarius indigo]